MATMSPLRRRMIDDMMVRNLSPATQQRDIRVRITATAPEELASAIIKALAAR